MRIAPPAPWISTDIHGKHIVILFIIHSGTVEEGKAAIAPIKAFGQPVGDVIQPRSYISQQTILDATQPKGRRYYWKSEYLPELDPGILPKLVAHASRIPSPHSAILLFPIDGRLNELPEDHSAVGNRDASFVLNITSSWEDTGNDDANITWARDAWQDMRRFSTGGTYVNFLTEDEGDDRTHSAYKDNYQRLVEIKTQWDPGNMFRVNKNIAPQ